MFFGDDRLQPVADAVPHSVIVVGLGAQQIGVIVLTILFAGFFASNRAETLALRAPRGGWGMLLLAFVPLFAITGAWSALHVVVAP